MSASGRWLRWLSHRPTATTPMHHALRPALLAAALGLAACAQRPAPADARIVQREQAARDAELLARGKYLVMVTGCNDCHTPGYDENEGNVPEQAWLVGSPLGYTGPWGTTYAANLRLKFAHMDEASWLKASAVLQTRPIMPDHDVRAMTEDDRRALYRFVRSLGPAGYEAPAYLPPGQEPPPPYMRLVLPESSAPAG